MFNKNLNNASTFRGQFEFIQKKNESNISMATAKKNRFFFISISVISSAVFFFLNSYDVCMFGKRFFEIFFCFQHCNRYSFLKFYLLIFDPVVFRMNQSDFFFSIFDSHKENSIKKKSVLIT